MPYQVALNSRNVLTPVTLEDHLGRRFNEPLTGLDTANAMVIRSFAGGGFAQDMFPLRATTGANDAYAGADWELRAQKVSGEWHVYYLGIPDRFLAASGPDGREVKSIAVQLIGTSPLTGREEFAGGVDLHLQAQVELPLIPGFINLAERFFPTLLPSSFIEAYALDTFAFKARKDLLLVAALQPDPYHPLPVSLDKHWDPKQWADSVVENLDASGQGRGYFTIKGGCFYARNHRLTHWFGGGGPVVPRRASSQARGARGIGLEEPGFREAAAEKIREMGVSGKGAWVFWLEPQASPSGAGEPDGEALRGQQLRDPHPRFSVRHPMLHRMLQRGSAGRAAAPLPPLPALSADRPFSADAAVEALAGVAAILERHQAELHQALAEPSASLWAGGTRPASAGKAPERPLEADIRDLYRGHGEVLSALEAAFDQSSGYAAWDAQANPMREMLGAYLAGAE